MIPSLLMATSSVLADLGPTIVVDLPNSTQNATRTVTDPANANAGWRFGLDGEVDRRRGSWSLGHHDWCTPTGGTPGDDFEIRCTKNSGTNPTGSGLGTWLALSSDRNWQLAQTVVGSKTCNLTIEIRDAATQTVQDSQTYTITATVNSGGTTTTTTTTTAPTTGTTTEGTF